MCERVKEECKKKVLELVEETLKDAQDMRMCVSVHNFDRLLVYIGDIVYLMHQAREIVKKL